MWQVMQVAGDTARKHFSSWEEYGRSFAMGRGVLARRRGGLPDCLGDRQRAARRGGLAVAADIVERIANTQYQYDGTGN